MPLDQMASACNWIFDNQPGGHLSAADLATDAVKAWARHRFTTYDQITRDLRIEGHSWESAKCIARDEVREQVYGMIHGW